MGKWNLDVLYTGFDTEEYASDFSKLEALIPELSSLAEKCTDMPLGEFLTAFVELNEQINALVGKDLFERGVSVDALFLSCLSSFFLDVPDAEQVNAIAVFLGEILCVPTAHAAVTDDNCVFLSRIHFLFLSHIRKIIRFS